LCPKFFQAARVARSLNSPNEKARVASEFPRDHEHSQDDSNVTGSELAAAMQRHATAAGVCVTGSDLEERTLPDKYIRLNTL
jgi:hypothetical protein